MTTITLEAGAARFLAEALLPAASKDDVTPVLTGVHLSIENGKLRGTATDRYRVHTVLVDVVGEAPETLDALVPRSAIYWLTRHAGAYITRRHSPLKPVVVFEFSDTIPTRAVIRVREDATGDVDEQTMSTALIHGKFPPVMRLVETARTAETVQGEAPLNVAYLSSMRALGNTRMPAVVRFTKGDHRPGPVYLKFGEYAEAIIQPNAKP